MATYTKVGATSVQAFPACCQTRSYAGYTWLIICGAGRGKLWKVNTTTSTSAPTVWSLGHTAPAAAPTVAAASGGNAYAGTYYCAYRWLDGDDIPSSLSPAAAVAATSNQKFTWSAISTPTDTTRSTKVEFYRTTVDNASIFYKVGAGTVSSWTTLNDTASDASLISNTALPVKNDDGSLNARRYGIPPSGTVVVLPFKERYLYITADSIYYSYPDEPESVPSVNCLKPLIPADDADSFVGGVSANVAYLFRHRHTCVFSYGQDPRWDGAFAMPFARGILNARCFARYDGDIYCLDEFGPWRIRGGAMDYQFAMRVQDWFRDDRITWGAKGYFMVTADPSEGIVRYHVVTSEGSYAAHAITYDVVNDKWTYEEFPLGLSAGFTAVAGGRARSVFSTTNSRLVYTYPGTSDLLTTGIQLTCTAATTGSLTVAGYNFTPYANYKGMWVTMTSGVNRGVSLKLDSASGTTITFDTTWTYGAPSAGDTFMFGSIPFSYKTARLALDQQTEDDSGRSKRMKNRVLTLRFEPTDTNQWVSVKVYFDADTAVTPITPFDDTQGVRSTRGGDGYELNLSKTASTYGGSPGYFKFRIPGRNDEKCWTHKTLTVELSGVQGDKEIILYSLDVEDAE